MPTLAPTAGLPALPDQRDQPLRRGHRLGGRGALQQQREFVGADPRRQVLDPGFVAQHRRHRFQQAVARRVPERVVDEVKGVDVEQQQRPRLMALQGVEEPFFHLFHELVAVEETAVVDRLSHRALRLPGWIA